LTPTQEVGEAPGQQLAGEESEGFMGRVKACAFVVAVLVIGAFPASAAAGVAPNPVGEIDCNGLSPIQAPAHPTAACADPHGDWAGRFYDNGHYIGHDEPSVRFISNKPGTGDDVTFVERLGHDPSALPTVSQPGNDITHYFELTVAPWVSTTVCDPKSAPMLPCKPESDSNAPTSTSPGGGAGFVELQFYPPGFAPLTDNISCDNTHWCSALNIDSLECNPDGSNCNNDCPEPVNFAFIQTNGVPTGPPSPQESDSSSFTPNGNTLLMNPGDTIVIHMFDVSVPGGGRALEASEYDESTHQLGYMIASAANGFMNTSKADCSGTPFNFAAEYSSAAAQNIIPWGAGPYMLDTEYEIGHFEPCTKVTGPQTFTEDVFSDTYWTNCKGSCSLTQSGTSTTTALLTTPIGPHRRPRPASRERRPTPSRRVKAARIHRSSSRPTSPTPSRPATCSPVPDARCRRLDPATSTHTGRSCATATSVVRGSSGTPALPASRSAETGSTEP
jgi:hypothetical protein